MILKKGQLSGFEILVICEQVNREEYEHDPTPLKNKNSLNE